MRRIALSTSAVFLAAMTVGGGQGGTNVIWKTAIPGLGLSSPVVWGDELFISTSIMAIGKK